MLHEHSGSEQFPHFIREVLGCQCPDSALANIRICPEPEEVAGIPLTLCVAIDGRLLVYVVCTDRPRALVESFASVFEAGKSARDQRGFHRFRFVVGTASPGDVREELMTAFYAVPGIDDRQHLHVVSAADIPT